MNMNCMEIKEALSLYIDDKLDETAAQQVSRHLETCTACHQEYELLTQTIAVLRSLPQLALPEGFDARLHGELVKESKWLKGKYPLGYVSDGTPKARRSPFSGWKQLSGVIAACLVIVIGASLYDQGVFDELYRSLGSPDTIEEAAAPEAAAKAGDSGAPENQEALSLYGADAANQDTEGGAHEEQNFIADSAAGGLVQGTGGEVEEDLSDSQKAASERVRQTKELNQPAASGSGLVSGGADQSTLSARMPAAEEKNMQEQAAASRRKQFVEARLLDTFSLRIVDSGTLKYSLASYTKIDENQEIFVYNIEGVKNGLPVTTQLRIQASGEGDAITLAVQ